MDFIVKINIDNDAFRGNVIGELTNILNNVIRGVEAQSTQQTLRDSNGNSVGSFYFEGTLLRESSFKGIKSIDDLVE